MAMIDISSKATTRLYEQDVYRFVEIAEALQQVRTVDDFRQIVEIGIRKLIPHEISICGFVDIATYEVDTLINMGYPEGFLKMILHERELGSAVDSPVVRAWSMESKTLQVDDSFLFNPRYRAWTEGARIYHIKNLLVNGVTESHLNRFSYFSFTNHLVPITDHHHRIMNILVPHLHFALSHLSRMSHMASLQDEKASVELSAREIQILNLINSGLSNTEIAERLNLSVHTIKNHIKKIFQKLGAQNRVHAVSVAKKTGHIHH